MKDEIPAFYREDSILLQFLKVWIDFMQMSEYCKVFANLNNSYDSDCEMNFIYLTLDKIKRNKKHSPEKYAFTETFNVNIWKTVYIDAFYLVFDRQSKIPYKWWNDYIEKDIIECGLTIDKA